MEEEECQGQESSSQQVTQSSEVGDGGVVGVNITRPHGEHHDTTDVEEQGDLQHCCHHVGEQEERRGVGVARLQETDGQGEEEVTRDDEGEEESGCVRVLVITGAKT